MEVSTEELRNQLLSKSREKLISIAKGATDLKKKESRTAGKRYIPNGKCEDFLGMVGEGKTFISLFNAGNGVGKTAVGCNIISNICFGKQNEWFDYSLYNHWPYIKKGRIIADPKTIKEKIVPELKKWLPEGRYTTSKEGQHFESKWITDTGWSIDIMSYEQRVKEFESVELGFVLFDEPPPRPIFMATMGRARKGMICMMTMTPLEHAAWVKTAIVEEADKERIQGNEERTQNYITAHIEDNCKQHGVRGILEHEDIMRMISKYPENEKEARVSGKFGHLVGRVHKKFDKNIHVIKPFAMKQEDFAVYHFLDPHPRTPDAASWFALDRNNQIYKVAELYMNGGSAELAQAIKDVEKKNNLRVEGRYIDPSAFTEDQHIEKSLADDLAEYSLFYQAGSKDLAEGIRLTDEALHYTINKNSDMIQKPRFFVFNTCARTIWEFDNYIWDEWKGRESVDRNPKPKPKDVDDHMMENIHRAFLAQIRFLPMVRESHPVEDANYDPYPTQNA